MENMNRTTIGLWGGGGAVALPNIFFLNIIIYMRTNFSNFVL